MIETIEHRTSASGYVEVPLSALGSIPNPTLSTCWYWYFGPISAYR